jgi:hypothetical protein
MTPDEAAAALPPVGGYWIPAHARVGTGFVGTTTQVAAPLRPPRSFLHRRNAAMV